MREYKFRAWIREQKRMTYTDIDNMNRWSMPVNMWAEIMQSVGIKDKNKKDIYEGDIIRDKGDYAVVVWNNLGWKLKYQYEETPQQFCGYYSELEVIGNIYENAELLQ